MTRWHFSIRAALVGTLVVAVGCAAIANPSPVWTGVLLALTAQALLSAAFRTLSPQVRPRAAYVAFLAGCLGYLSLAFGPWFDPPVLRILGPFQLYDDNMVLTGGSIEITTPRMSGPHLGVFPPTRLLEEVRRRSQVAKRASTLDASEDEIFVLSNGVRFTLDPSKFSVPWSEFASAEKSGPKSLDIWKETENAFFQCGHLLLSWVAGVVIAAAVCGVCGFARRAAKQTANRLILTPAADAE